MISLLNPSLLPWLAAAAIPIAIHLLTRRTRRQMDLPTLRFLKTSIAQQSRLYRVRHLVLLALRTAAALAILLAFLKPTINSALGSSGSEHSVIILVIDTSASMSYTEGGTSSLSRARNDAIKVLEQLKPGDAANVVFCGTQPHSVFTQPGDDLADLEHAVRDMRVSEERADPPTAINAAVDQLTKVKQKSRRIYIFSDFQRTNWASVKFDAVPADCKLVFAASAPDHLQNAGISAVHIYPSVPRVGDPVTAECDVFNSSDSVRTIPVTLSLPDGTHTVQTVTAAPNATATARYSLKFDKPARVECVFKIPADNMILDDTRRAVIDLRKMPSVVMITAEDVGSPKSGGFFINHALRPDPAAESGFRVTVVKPIELNNATLHGADAVIVCNAKQMPSVQFQALAKYLTEGGSLIWFLTGENIADQIGSLAKQLPAAEPMPITVLGALDLAGNGKGFVTLTEAHYESPLLKVFKDPTAADLGQIHFNKICSTSEVNARAETLLKFDDGTAAAIRCGEGGGSLLLVNMSPDPAWSDLARQDAFVPLLHEFLKGVSAHDSGNREYYAGGPAADTIASQSQSDIGSGSGSGTMHITCVGPSGSVPVTADPVTGSVVVELAKQTGFYHLFAGNNPVSTLAINVHADESDLRPIDPRELESDKSRRNSILTGSSVPGEDVSTLNNGKPLWHLLLIGSMILLCAEAAVTRMTPKVRT